MNLTVTVLGAGMVGVCCALALQEKGFEVTLIDKSEPGEETSYGNSGVVTPSSLMPLNNPGLFASLPKLLRNNQASLRYSFKFLRANPKFTIGFLRNATVNKFEATTQALHDLIALSSVEHKRLSAASCAQDHWRDTGWLMLHRDEAAFAASALARRTYDTFGLRFEVLDSEQLAILEPALTRQYFSGLWVKDARSVDSPSKVVKAYARLFLDRGGRFERREVTSLGPLLNEPGLLVLAAGPWSAALLKSIGVVVPMGYERGYHQHFKGALGGARLKRPFYDTGGAFVVAPMQQGLRLTTGVELNAHLAPSNLDQLRLAEASARTCLDLGDATADPVWRGARPTLPDSRPIIGPLAAHPKLWGAFGHQHIGFSTGPGTGVLLAEQISQKFMNLPAISAKIGMYFSAARFSL